MIEDNRPVQIERRVLGNAAFLGVGSVVGHIANFGFVILVARGFGREVFAHYALSMAIGALACILVSFGSISLLTRTSAQDRLRGSEMLSAVLPVQAMIAIALWIAILGLAFVFPHTTESLIILACVLAHHIIVRLTGVLLSQVRGRERLDIIALVRVGRRITTLGAGVVLALATGSALAGISAMPIASLFFLLYSGSKVKGLVGPIPWKWDPRGAWNVTRKAFPFFLIVAVTAACDRLGPVLLGAIQDPDSLATYASGERIITFVAVLYSTLTAASVPASSRLALSDAEAQLRFAHRIMRLVLLAVLPTATLLFLFSPDIIVLLFGREFATSAPVLQVAAWIPVVRGFNSVQAMVAVSRGRQRDVLIGRCCALILLIVCGVPLIWLVGPVGLAITVLALEIGYTAVLHRLLARADIDILPSQSLWGIVATCVATLVVGLLSADLYVAYRLALLGGCVIAGSWIFGAVRRHDLRYLHSVLMSRRSDLSEDI
jgi:O-antigen/teichoic acid export membrane protein